MKKLIIIFTLLLCTQNRADLSAQHLPLVYEMENTGSNYPKPPVVSLSQLPILQSLPDPFRWADGRGRLVNLSDWRYRRAEIGALIQNYEIGVKPVRPDTITAGYSGGILTVIVTKNGKSLTLTSQVILPSGRGPFPAVIGTAQSVPSAIFSSRNIAQIPFNYNQVSTDGNASNSNPYYQLYTDLNIDNTGQYSAWAWGVSRIIDGLELVQDLLPIDLKHIAVSGCSRGGKMALFAGAFDERIALTIAQESGGGGATSWRYSHSETPGTVELIDNTDYNWFKNSMKDFSGDNVSKLPTDHHELMAMVAPRALLVTANPDFTWLSNPSCYVSSKACQQVYNALGISDRFGFSIIGGHNHCAVPNSQIPEIEAFVDKFLLGIETVNTNITTAPYTTNLSPWITWTAPVLANGTSFFGRTSLVFPSNLITGVDTTNITFRWKKIADAGKYIFQLSTDPAFSKIDKTDSTATDTVKTFTGFLGGKKYYWRVRVIDNSGSPGPWSDFWNFTTFVNLPAAPPLVSASPYSNRQGWVTVKWNKVEFAAQYSVQLAETQSFTYGLLSASTSDTTAFFTGLMDNYKYYWRVQANNVAGSGPWSDVGDYAVLSAPTNLVLQRSALKEITLTWNDNTTAEDGYLIERKQSQQSSFSLLDTLKGSGNLYVDKKVEQALTYVYRVKAYIKYGVSDYSNEASFTLVGVREEGIPQEYSISQNYPNPFNPATKLKFGLPKTAQTKLIVYDLLGRELQILVDHELNAGYHEINFDAGNIPSGVYFYRIQSGDFAKTKRMILMK